jgi:hypothetical protein
MMFMRRRCYNGCVFLGFEQGNAPIG